MTAQLDLLAKQSRVSVTKYLGPMVDRYFREYRSLDGGREFRKLIELSTKMQVVGRAWADIAGFQFDQRRERISALFGACCHVGDGFLDDFGPAASLDYMRRFGVFLTNGWFDIRNDLERLFYIIVSRLFFERDVLKPMLRQALCSLFRVQALDVVLTASAPLAAPTIQELENCGRDRSGHAITALGLFIVPELSLNLHHILYNTGSLISHIDDYGDYYYDRILGKRTYINTIADPAADLARRFVETFALIDKGIPTSRGSEMLKTFLHRYYTSRLRKHDQEKQRQNDARPVYE